MFVYRLMFNLINNYVMNSKILVNKVDTIRNYQKLMQSKIHTDKDALNFYKIPLDYSKQYESDLKALKEFDKNVIWDKPFWGIKYGGMESICAIAVPISDKLKYAINFKSN